MVYISRSFNTIEGKIMSIYTDNGYKNRKDYLNNLADYFGVDVDTVYQLASILGADEDFDGLVTSLEDFVEGGY